MDQLGLLGQSGPAGQAPGTEPPGKFMPEAIAHTARERMRFPGDDNHRSLAQMAKSDLEAALQLLVDRAKYITGASGAAIALVENGKMVCRASAGASAPEIGAYLQMDSGLTGESVRQKKLLRCDDVETDLRVNRESCRALGIVSVVVQPLIRDSKVIGIFELLSGKAYAFEERDINAVERLGEMIQTALEVEPDIGFPDPGIQNWPLPSSVGNVVKDKAQAGNPHTGQAKLAGSSLSLPASDAAIDSKPLVPIDPEIVSQLHASIGKCTACGFPVSGGRSLCLDCEASNVSETAAPVGGSTPSFLDHYSDAKPGNWFTRNIYWIGIVIMSLATVALLALKSR